MTGNQVTLVVVVAHLKSCLMTIVQVEHAQPVADGDARRHNQEVVSKARVLHIVFPVQVIIQDEHGHDDRLARAGSHLKGCAGQDEPRVIRCRRQPFIQLAQQVTPDVGVEVGHLIQIDGRLNGLTLAEEQLQMPLAVWILEPIVQQLPCDTGDATVTRLSPFPHLPAYLIDKGRIGVCAFKVRAGIHLHLFVRLWHNINGCRERAATVNHMRVVKIPLHVCIIIQTWFLVWII